MSRKILITGASRGIGRASALALVKNSDRVILACRERMEELENVSKILKARGAETLLFEGDLQDTETIGALFHSASDFYGTPDVLVNNAGLSCTGLFQDISDADLLRVIAVDLTSVMLLTKKFLPGMIARKSGRIIQVSSVFGRTGASCEAVYSTAKGGIDAFTRSLAKELAPSNIQVNAVAPGFIDTEMNARLTEEEREALFMEIPAGRAGTAEETARLISFLAEAPEYFTGQILTVDGAWT